MINRKEEIVKNTLIKQDTVPQQRDLHSQLVDYDKGIKKFKGATLKLEKGDYHRINPRLGAKDSVLTAISNTNIPDMVEISNYFYKTSGIYKRLCRYLAYLYRYDWFVTPYVVDKKMKKEKITSTFQKVLYYLDNFEIKRFLGDAALSVIKNGSYYGYIVYTEEKPIIQELPAQYCRSRFKIGGRVDAIEFNLRFFVENFRSEEQRNMVLKLFPPEFRKAYNLLENHQLPPQYPGDSPGWYLLSPENAFKFSMDEDNVPPFISVIPAIIDLDEAKSIDRQRMKQKLSKIITQRMPVDKNGDPIFDVPEAQALHLAAVEMLKNVPGTDVLTTFADVDAIDMSEKGNTSAMDELTKVERSVFNESGVSQKQFNTDGNIALEKSILNDEASMSDLILQFQNFLNLLLKPFNNSPKKIFFRIQILNTTINNYKEMSKIYKEQTQLGYSKMLPQIALGQSQSSILSTAEFENDILDLVHVFIPPMMSSTMNADALGDSKNNKDSKKIKGQEPGQEEKKVGRKEKEDDQKTEKTIANRESMG